MKRPPKDLANLLHRPVESAPQSSHTNYLAADFNLGKWDFNVGIGHASGQSPDNTVLKAIIGVPF